MAFFWVKTNRLIKWIFSRYVWELPNTTNTIYLTFDDGPEPEVTPWVLDVLQQHHIKATFFCIGNNIEKHPELFARVVAEGHAIGNHTYNHFNGWKTSFADYIANATAANAIMQRNSVTTNLFRPPYGKLKPSQAKKLRELGYKIIMWDILTVDYDKNITKEQCLENATKEVAAGSILIFHDSIKAFQNLEYALPATIELLKNKGFRFEAIRSVPEQFR